MCFNIECISLALWQIKCWCSFTCKSWREIHLDRYISILRRTARSHQKQQANMETFTIHDMLINSTDIYKILCGLGIGNLSECKNDNDATSEPKGKENLIFFYCILLYCLRILSTEKLSLCAEKLWTSLDRFCTTLHIWVKVHCIVCLLNLVK